MEAASSSVASVSVRATRWRLAGLVVAFVLAADQISKSAVRSAIPDYRRREVTGSLSFVNIHNKGVAFGFLGGSGVLVLFITLSALVFLLLYFALHAERALLWIPTGLVIGGALGNVIDRLRQGYVTDFVHVARWPAFNLADVCISCGVVSLVLIVQLRGRPTSD